MSTQQIALEKLILSGIKGRIIWSEQTTRIRLENGSYFDLGKRSWKTAFAVSKRLGFPINHPSVQA